MLVAGADVPHVFCCAENKNVSYTLVGETYIHGIMFGEATKNGLIEPKTIQVV